MRILPFNFINAKPSIYFIIATAICQRFAVINFLKAIDKSVEEIYNISDESYPLAFVSVADTLGARSQERGVSETL